jgi:ankyrin repeat protein
MRPQRPKAVPLHYAALFGFRDLTEDLLAKHPDDVHAKGGSDVTPLHVAAGHCRDDVLSLLSVYLTEMDIQGNYLWTPLHLASIAGYVGIGSWLLDCGAEMTGLLYTLRRRMGTSSSFGCYSDEGRRSMTRTTEA